MESYKPGIGISAGSLMLKWDMLNQHIMMNQMKFQPGDDVNVFINFESIMNNLSQQRGVASTISYYKQDVVIEVEAAILNLVAHYRSYFKKEKCNPKVYLYYTSLDNDCQMMQKFNQYYRSFYKNKYMSNPQYRALGELLHDIIIPEIKLILSYIPNCYFLETSGIEGSIIPLAVSMIQGGKNVIVTGDIYDTLYMFNPNFLTLYIERKYNWLQVCSDIESMVRSIIKDESPFDITIFNSEMYYRLLLSIHGNKIRNIRGVSGFGTSELLQILKHGMDDGTVLKGFSTLTSIISLFPLKYRNAITASFTCTDLEVHYGLMSETDIDVLKSQIVDRIDMESVESLNNKRFLNAPINIQGLLY